MRVLVRSTLGIEPAGGLEELVEQTVEAEWFEERQAAVLAGAVAKALGGGR